VTDAVADEQGGDLAALGEFSRSWAYQQVTQRQKQKKQWMERQHHKAHVASWFSGWFGTMYKLSSFGAKTLSWLVSFVPLSWDTTRLYITRKMAA
jgi:hypothetical protein